jgi:hypothetical protein
MSAHRFPKFPGGACHLKLALAMSFMQLSKIPGSTLKHVRVLGRYLRIQQIQINSRLSSDSMFKKIKVA